MFKELGNDESSGRTVDTSTERKLSKHHRKAEVNGGTGKRRNISYVLRSDHDAWHILYDTLEAKDILVLLKNDYEVYGTDIQKSDLAHSLYIQYSEKDSEQKRRRIMWDRLFFDKSLDEILKTINTKWLDPDYVVQKEVVRVKTFRLVEGALSSTPKNLVSKEISEGYDTLYGTLDSPAMIRQLIEDYEVYGADVKKSTLLKTLHEGWANTTNAKIKRTKAWAILFSGMTAEEIAAMINTIWHNRGCSLRVETTRIFTIGLTSLV